MAKTIDDYKRDYAEAASKGDAAGMKAANDGANAIRASRGEAAQVASADIAKVASGGTSGMVSDPDKYDDGGYSSSRSSGGSGSRSSGGSSGGGSDTSRYENTDYSALWDEALASGADYDTMESIYRNRVQKTTSIPEYGVYYGDAKHLEMMNWLENNKPTASSGGSGSGAVQSRYPTNTQQSYYQQQAADLSAYLEELYAAQRKQALASLENAYRQNVNAINAAGTELKNSYQKNLDAIDASGVGIDTKYQNARNQAAGASELAARNFHEQAAAMGLNSGAGGQAELARNVALQNNLNDLNAAEANIYANLELQKSNAASDYSSAQAQLELQLANAETEYNSAIAQAEAGNDYALAQSLYQEKVRVQQALVDQQLQQFQMDLQTQQLQLQQDQAAANSQLAQQQFQFQQDQAALSNQLAQQQYADEQAANDRASLAAYGNTFLEQGLMPSGDMLSAMGITAADAQAYIDQLSLMGSMEAAKPTLSYSQTMDAINSGNLTPNVLSAYQYYMGAAYGGGTTGSGSGGTNNKVVDAPKDDNGGGDTGLAMLQSELLNLEDRLNPSAVPSAAASLIQGYYTRGSISEATAKKLLGQYGLHA